MSAPKTAGEIAEGLSEEERKALLEYKGSCDTLHALTRLGLLSFCPPNWLVSAAWFPTSLGKQVAQELQKRG